MEKLIHDTAVDALTNRHKTSDKVSWIGSDNGGDSMCALCGENPCVWVCQREAVIANNENEHGHTFTIVNKTRCKIAFQRMFRVINGGPGQKGIRKQLPECVEKGIRALFSDDQYMGFKEV
jgi:hypothetical protein